MMLEMGKEIVLDKGSYTDKELNAIIGQKMKSRIDDHDDVLRTSKLYNIITDGLMVTVVLHIQ